MRLIQSTLLVSALAVCSAAIWASPQQQSVAEAARKAQAAKKNTSQPAKVITNDDITNLKGDVSVIGPADQSAAPAQDAKAPAATTAKPAAKTEAEWRKEFSGARKTLADDMKELDVLQREYNLKEQQYYSDPNQALREQNDRKDLNDTKAQIDQKTVSVDKDKQSIADLEDQLRQSGGDPGWANQ